MTGAINPAARGGRGLVPTCLGAVALALFLTVKPGGPDVAAWVGTAVNLGGPFLGLGLWLRSLRRNRADDADLPVAPAATAAPSRALCAASSLLLGLSIVAFTGGQLVFYYYDRIKGVHPFPSPADAFFLAAYPLQMAAILLLPCRPGSGLRTGRAVLDGLITVAALATFSWYFVLGPMVLHSAISPLARALAASYPALGLAILFCLVLIPAGAGAARFARALRPFAAGLLVIVLGDAVFAHQNLRGTHVTGHPNDVTWGLGYLLLGVAAARLRRSPAVVTHISGPVAGSAASITGGEHAAPFWHALLPYGLMPPVAALLFYVHTVSSGGALHRGVEVGTLTLVLFVIARQLLSIAENARLNDKLRQALRERDASHRSLAESHENLRDSEQRFRLASQSAGDLIYECRFDRDSLEWFGDIDCRLGYAAGEFPRTMAAWKQAIHPDDRARVNEALEHHLRDGEPFAAEYRVATRGGQYLMWVDRGCAIRDAAGRAVRMVGAMSDVTSRRAAEQRLRYDSLHDALTGLPNRVLFCERIEQCIQRARRMPGYQFAVLFLDLDRFKVINDSLGHAAGDRLLVAVSERLRQCLRGIDAVARDRDGPGEAAESEAVARLGGDEFTVLLEDLRTPEDALRVAERIQAELARPIRFEGHDIVSSASIGITHGGAGTAYETAKELLRDADAAMYRAKSAGRARHAVFDATMHEAAVERLRLESDLRRALERDELQLEYQPIVSLSTRELIGFETLLRWRRAGGQAVNPDEFVPVAEDTGMIVPIGAWVIREACRQLAAWNARHPGRPPLSVSVNVSRRQLADPGVVEHCRQVVRDTGIDPSCLKLEITESVIVEDKRVAADVLAALKSVGIGLHIDDFGTGYSSLSCLHEFPLNGLKIDRAFSFHSDKRDHAAIINAIINLAHNLGMTVTAEGIESAGQLALLQGLDCDSGQGYYFARPMNPEAAGQLIAAGTTLALSA